jgi:GT2 family glycosyltransferase
MTTYVVSVRSYNRPERLRKLLGDLDEQRRGHDVRVTVYDDASTEDMSNPHAFAFCQRIYWERMDRHHGKHHASNLWNVILSDCREQPGEPLYVFLDDDMRLCSRFFERALTIWEGINARHKATLTLIVDDSREHTDCWTGVKPTAAGHVTRTQWVDMAWLCDHRALNALGWEVPDFGAGRWAADPSKSTGVGQWISRKLHQRGDGLYRVAHSLVCHSVGSSHMNPEARKRASLLAVRFVDGEAAHRRLAVPGTVCASLATVPERLDSLERAASSLIPQVDRLHIFLNGHDEVPAELSQEPCVRFRRSQVEGDLGDVGKFSAAFDPPLEGTSGYIFTCDDDLEYPSDYVIRMCAAVERYDRKAVVGVHGVTFKDKLGTTYQLSRQEVYRFGDSLESDHAVHWLGTGCLAYHRSALDVHRDDFELNNCADAWFACLCQRKRVPRMVVRHPAGWLRQLPVPSSLADQPAASTAPMRAIRKGAPWRLCKPEAPR